MKIEFEISDDASFLGLINTDQYNSFVDENWEFEQVKERIINESNKGHLLFWGTDIPNFWTVRICDQPIAKEAFKSFEGKIKVTNSRLYLINYESLTLAAQFEEEQLPEEHLADLYVKLQNAVYNVTIRQLFDPEKGEIEDILGFEIVLQKSKTKNSKTLNSFNELIWSEY
ncbi:hypothetical protein OAK19_01770 [Aureispira]|nr:hypothetical protein [Aureispira sp.]